MYKNINSIICNKYAILFTNRYIEDLDGQSASKSIKLNKESLLNYSKFNASD